MRRLLLTIFIFTTLVYMTGCKESIKDPEEGYFKGRVTDTSGHPLYDVQVFTLPPHTSTHTDSNGYFDLRAFPRTYRVIFRKGKRVYHTWVDTLPNGVIDTFELRYDLITQVETLAPVIDTVDTFILRITMQKTTIDTDIYRTVKSDIIELDPGEIFNFGDVQMETTLKRIEIIDTLEIDTLH